MKVLSNACLLFMLPTLAVAATQNRGSDFSLVSRYNTYSDFQTSENSTSPVEMKPTYEVELGLRLKSFFSFIVSGQRSSDSLHSAFGGGFRVDTPGFFWLGGSAMSGRFPKRNFPVNTSIFGLIMQAQTKTDENSPTEKALATNMGLAIDVFLFNNYVFLTAQGSVLNMQGNGFTVVSYGLGAEF